MKKNGEKNNQTVLDSIIKEDELNEPYIKRFLSNTIFWSFLVSHIRRCIGKRGPVKGLLKLFSQIMYRNFRILASGCHIRIKLL